MATAPAQPLDLIAALPTVLASLRHPRTALTAALALAVDTADAEAAGAYAVAGGEVRCLGSIGPGMPNRGRVDPVEARAVLGVVDGADLARVGPWGGWDWAEAVHHLLPESGSAVVVLAGDGPGPRRDATEVSGPVALLAALDVAEARTAELTAELHALRGERALVSATLRHDLRHPIQAVSAAADMLVDDTFEMSEEERGELLGIIRSEVQRLNRMVDADFASSLAGGDVPPKRRPVDMSLIATQMAAAADAGRQGEMVVEVEPATLSTDADLLGRALLNLLDNALRHSPDDVPVQLIGRIEGGFYELCVIDGGPGVDPAKVPTLFSAFSTDGNGEGTGLGLHSVADICRRLGGRISYSRTEATTFSISLPGPEEDS